MVTTANGYIIWIQNYFYQGAVFSHRQYLEFSEHVHNKKQSDKNSWFDYSQIFHRPREFLFDCTKIYYFDLFLTQNYYYFFYFFHFIIIVLQLHEENYGY